MIKSLIVAVGRDLEIGLNSQMLWHIKEDFAHFKRTTMGHTLIMGRKTFESIGRPLPGRKTFILTRNDSYSQEGCEAFTNLESALARAREDGEEEVFIAGGGEIYKHSLGFVDKIYLSEVDFTGEADAFFPKLDMSLWQDSDEIKAFDATESSLSWRLRVLKRKES